MVSNRIILHAFQWELRRVIDNLDNISKSGYNAVQVSPIAPTKDENNSEFWMLYQPIDFTVGNKQIGSREDLVKLCEKASSYGIEIIADIVLRHLAGSDDGSLNIHERANFDIASSPDYWLDRFEPEDMECRHNIINGCFGLPVINYYNHDVQDIYINYLDDLIDCGVSSFRIDMGKHFALPEENCDFWTRVIGRYSDRFNYAENLNCSTELQDRYSEYVGILGSEPCSDNDKFVAHFETHDSFHTFNSTKGMTDEERISSWKWLLNTNKNALWFSRPFDSLTFSKEITEINWSSRGL